MGVDVGVLGGGECVGAWRCVRVRAPGCACVSMCAFALFASAARGQGCMWLDSPPLHTPRQEPDLLATFEEAYREQPSLYEEDIRAKEVTNGHD